MTPYVTPNYCADNLLTNTKVIGKGLLRDNLRLVRGSYEQDVCRSQLAAMLTLPARSSALARFVRVVVRLSAKPEMVRPATPGMVARMAHVESVRNWAEAHFPCDARCDMWPTSNLEVAAAIEMVPRSNPGPAPVSANHLGPEALLKRYDHAHASRRWMLARFRRNDAQMVESNEQAFATLVDQRQRQHATAPTSAEPRLFLHRGTLRGVAPPTIRGRAGALCCVDFTGGAG